MAKMTNTIIEKMLFQEVLLEYFNKQIKVQDLDLLNSIYLYFAPMYFWRTLLNALVECDSTYVVNFSNL